MKVLDHLEEWLITVLLAAGTIIVFVAVVHRYASGWPIPGVQDALIKLNTSWAQELTIYMFVWMAKFGAAYGVRTGIHVGVDILLGKLNPPWRDNMIVVGLLAGATFTGIIGTLGSKFVYELSHTSSVSEVLELPMWIVYLAMPLGSFLMSFRFLQVAWRFVKTGELPRHDQGHVEGIDEAAEGRA